MEITKDDMDVFISRIDDRFDKIEKMLQILVEKKNIKGKKPFYYNADVMEITGLSYRTIQDYRLSGELKPLNKNGINLYTEQEVHRFITESIPKGRYWKKRKSKKKN